MSNILHLSDQKYWNNYAKDYIAKITQWLQEGSQYSSMKSFFLAYTKLDWSTKRSGSRGGWYKNHKGPGISIGMWVVCGRTKANDTEVPMKVYEYQSFSKDREIGNFYTNDKHHHLLLHICHEMAHAAQYWHKRHHKMGRIRPHGDEFKMFYREIRNYWLNPYLPDQVKTGRAYRKHRNISILQEFAA